MNAHEQLARERKAALLADYLDREGYANVIDHMTDAHWAHVAGKAGVKPPSAETIKLVREHLARRKGK